jgi:hypothetical protein
MPQVRRTIPRAAIRNAVWHVRLPGKPYGRRGCGVTAAALKSALNSAGGVATATGVDWATGAAFLAGGVEVGAGGFPFFSFASGPRRHRSATAAHSLSNSAACVAPLWRAQVRHAILPHALIHGTARHGTAWKRAPRAQIAQHPHQSRARLPRAPRAPRIAARSTRRST